jgi:hypothetical protein
MRRKPTSLGERKLAKTNPRGSVAKPLRLRKKGTLHILQWGPTGNGDHSMKKSYLLATLMRRFERKRIVS